MEDITENTKDSSKDKFGFFKYVFNFDDDNNAHIFNMLQFGLLSIIPIMVLLNLVKEFKVPSKKEFSIPLTVSLATDSILKKKTIGGILGSLISEQLDIAYKGNIKYKVLGHAFTYSIDESQRVKVNL